jgi:hypothetical protein
VLKAHICNPINSGGKTQEDCGLRPARTNSTTDPTSKIPNTTRITVLTKMYIIWFSFILPNCSLEDYLQQLWARVEGVFGGPFPSKSNKPFLITLYIINVDFFN